MLNILQLLSVNHVKREANGVVDYRLAKKVFSLLDQQVHMNGENPSLYILAFIIVEQVIFDCLTEFKIK